MLGITTMKLFQEWLENPPQESQPHLETNRQILIIGMSATALESEQEEAFKFGMHFFCPKPVSLDLLAIILNSKKASRSNEDAVNRICEITGTSEICENADDRSGLSTLIRARVTEGEGDIDQRGKWSLFRSHKQSSKRIFPDGDRNH